MKRRCVFFDRDGIVNESPGPGYVERWEDFVLMPEIPGILKMVRSLDYEAVVVSNQRCVARGIVALAEVNRIHDNLQKRLRQEFGVEFLDIFFCPHDNSSCDCRKPLPGMFLRAASRHGLDLAASWMVGDNEKDVAAGHAAGCRAILVSRSAAGTAAEFRVADMSELQCLLERVLVAV
jgi:histidinol-phosphate phosphatase family protein